MKMFDGLFILKPIEIKLNRSYLISVMKTKWHQQHANAFKTTKLRAIYTSE